MWESLDDPSDSESQQISGTTNMTAVKSRTMIAIGLVMCSKFISVELHTLLVLYGITLSPHCAECVSRSD
jgi:hypothetical protein